jgi:hypothetical protein
MGPSHLGIQKDEEHQRIHCTTRADSASPGSHGCQGTSGHSGLAVAAFSLTMSAWAALLDWQNAARDTHANGSHKYTHSYKGWGPATAQTRQSGPPTRDDSAKNVANRVWDQCQPEPGIRETAARACQTPEQGVFCPGSRLNEQGASQGRTRT